jgi:hypothetical protein
VCVLRVITPTAQPARGGGKIRHGHAATWDTYTHVALLAAQEGRLGEAYGEEVAAVGGVSKDGEGVGVRDGGKKW